MEKYSYPTGWFINTGNVQWEEWQKNNLSFHFKEEKRESGFIYLYDSSRNIWVILPFKGGKSYYASGGSSWTELYDVTLETPLPAPSDTQILPLQSTSYPPYYRIPDDTPGIEYAPWRFLYETNGAVETKNQTSLLWGQYIMIDFLIKLGKSWKVNCDDIYLLEDDFYSPIQLGDISPNFKVLEVSQGGPERIAGHKSHRHGLDVDIFVCSVDMDRVTKQKLEPKATDYRQTTTYSFEKTKSLALSIVKIADENNFRIDKIFYDDEKVKEVVSEITIDGTKIHENHFHVRLFA